MKLDELYTRVNTAVTVTKSEIATENLKISNIENNIRTIEKKYQLNIAEELNKDGFILEISDLVNQVKSRFESAFNSAPILSDKRIYRKEPSLEIELSDRFYVILSADSLELKANIMLENPGFGNREIKTIGTYQGKEITELYTSLIAQIKEADDLPF